MALGEGGRMHGQLAPVPAVNRTDVQRRIPATGERLEQNRASKLSGKYFDYLLTILAHEHI
jgi:hypothetical protein